MTARTLTIPDKYRPDTPQHFRHEEPLLFNGEAWEQMSRTARKASLRWCKSQLKKRNYVHHSWCRKWLELHGTKKP